VRAGADPADAESLADLRDVIFWRNQLPSGTVTDEHVAGPGPAFGSRTAGMRRLATIGRDSAFLRLLKARSR
jgi:hypothetical protein